MMHEQRPVRAGYQKRRRAVVTFHTPVAGRISWRTFEGDGKTPTLTDVVTRDGGVRRLHESPITSNLITNAGLDAFGGTIGAQHATNMRTIELLRRRVVVGTGSDAPAFTDIALSAEVQMATTGRASSVIGTLSTDGDDYVVTSVRTADITMTADRNLTEYGYREDTTAAGTPRGSLNIRELFRDELDDPITLSLLNGKILRILHTMTLRVPRSGILTSFDIEERDALNQVVSTVNHEVECGFYAGGAASAWVFVTPGYDPYVSRGAGPRTTNFSLPASTMQQVGSSPGCSTDDCFSTYLTGTYTRDWGATALIGQMVGTLYGVDYGCTSYDPNTNVSGLVIKFVNPSTFVKLNTHTLGLQMRHTWGRLPEGSS